MAATTDEALESVPTAKIEYATHDIDGIGGVKARVGTSIEELAGAAAYWNKRGKAAEAKLEKYGKSQWWTGFTTGLVSLAALALAARCLFFFF